VGGEQCGPCLRNEEMFRNESKQTEETALSWRSAKLCCFCAATAQDRAAQTLQSGETKSEVHVTTLKHFDMIITNRN
jgi:hypothetical protein